MWKGRFGSWIPAGKPTGRLVKIMVNSKTIKLKLVSHHAKEFTKENIMAKIDEQIHMNH